MCMIPIICLISIILLIQFRTDGVLEYSRLFRLNRITFHKDFDNKYKEDVSLTYLKYLRLYHNCFFVRLITCPICLSIWLGIIAGIITFSLLSVPIYIVGGLLLFAIIDKLLG